MRRRTFLGLLGLGALGAATASAATTSAFLASPVSAAVPQSRSPQMFRSAAAVRRIAEAYLRHAPAQTGPGWDALCASLGDARRADFRAGRTLVVDGWLVAESEARLCALAVLHGGAGC